jgi:hypothetical protein
LFAFPLIGLGSYLLMYPNSTPLLYIVPVNPSKVMVSLVGLPTFNSIYTAPWLNRNPPNVTCSVLPSVI